MDLKDYRNEIDRIDRELLAGFRERMEIAEKIARYKKENGLPVLDEAREKEKISRIAREAGPELAPYAEQLFEKLMELSRRYQAEHMEEAE